MGSSRSSRRMNILLWMTPVLIVIVGFFASLRWLSRLDDAVVLAVSAAVGVSVMAWSLVVGARHHRQLDEVERASNQFAWTWGATAGSVCTVLLLMLPPFRSLIVDLSTTVAAIRAGSEELLEHKSLVLAFTLGFVTLQLLQLVGTVVAASWWWAKRR